MIRWGSCMQVHLSRLILSEKVEEIEIHDIKPHKLNYVGVLEY